MQKVKRLVQSGARLSVAVREALGRKTLADLAREHGVNRTTLISGLNGGRALTARQIDALIAEFGGTPSQWRALLADEAHRRISARAHA